MSDAGETFNTKTFPSASSMRYAVLNNPSVNSSQDRIIAGSMPAPASSPRSCAVSSCCLYGLATCRLPSRYPGSSDTAPGDTRRAPDPDAPQGCRVRIRQKDQREGAHLADMVVPAGSPTYRATCQIAYSIECK